jgi:hypothetical protein
MVLRLLASAACLLLLARCGISSDAESAILVPGMPIEGKGAPISSLPTSVCLSSGGTVLAIGVPHYNKSHGATWVYHYNGSAWDEAPGALPLAPTACHLGYALSRVPAVGGQTDRQAGGVGGAWLYRYSGGGWVEMPGMPLLGQTASLQQGYAVSLSPE